MARANGNGTPARGKPHSKRLNSQEKIQLRAYEIYLERNGAPGNPLEDWVRAEREVLQKTRKSSKKPENVAA